MADNVRFLCDNGTAGVGYSGENGFPFPFGTAAPGVNNPAVVTFKDCIKWWWRVKNWHLQTNLAVVDTLGNPYALPSEDLSPVGGATRELDLINGATSHNFLNTTVGDWALNLALMPSGPNQIIKSGADSYPGIVIDFGLSFVGNGSGKMRFTCNDPGGGTPSFNGSIDGVILPIYYDVTSDPPTSFTASQFVLTPVEYWPYATMGGATPVYNTSTGAQILDPTS